MFGLSHTLTLRAEVAMDERVCTPGIGNKPAAGQVHDAVAAQAIGDQPARLELQALRQRGSFISNA
jgi:hypothetical protein